MNLSAVLIQQVVQLSRDTYQIHRDSYLHCPISSVTCVIIFLSLIYLNICFYYETINCGNNEQKDSANQSVKIILVKCSNIKMSMGFLASVTELMGQPNTMNSHVLPQSLF